MADKKVNIQIKSDIEQAKQSLEATKRMYAGMFDQLKAEENSFNEFAKKEAKDKADRIKKENEQRIQDEKRVHNEMMRNLKAQGDEYERMLKQQKQDAKNNKGMSTFQLLEMGENITVVMAGITAGINAVKGFVTEVWHLAEAGAEFKVLKDNFKGSEEDLKNFQKATGNTVTEGNLIKLSNQALDLGISLKDQSVFFLLAKESQNKYGGDLVENFTKIMNATEGNVKGLKSLGIQKAEYNERIKEIVKSMQGEVEESQNENGERELTIKNLSAEDQKKIRIQAIMELTGKTMKDVNGYIQTEADKMKEVNKRWEDFKEHLGSIMAMQISKEFDSIGNSLNNLGLSADKGSKGVLSLLGSLISVASSTNIILAPIKATLYVLERFKSSLQWLGILGKENTGQLPEGQYWTPMEKISKNTIPETNVNSFYSPEIPSSKLSGKGSSPKEVKEQLDDIQKLLKEISDLEEKRKLYLEKYPEYYGKQLDLLDELRKKQDELNKLRSPLREIKGLNEFGVIKDELKEKELITNEKGTAFDKVNKIFTDSFNAKLDRTKNLITGIAQGFQSFFETLTKGEGATASIKNFLKQILTSFINFTEATYFVGVAESFFKAIITLGTSLPSDLIWQALGLAGLESAKGLIGTLYSGTDNWRGGLTLVGERGAELVNLPRGSQVYNNAKTNSILSNANNNPINLFVNANLDAIGFMVDTIPKYNNYKKIIKRA